MAGWGDDETPPELEDSAEVKVQKIAKLVDMIKRSDPERIVVYTGAGISTAGGIPDYRGENGLQNKRTPLVVLGLSEQKTLDFTMPTYTHLALAKLINSKKIGFIATSNHDGLHQKAGTPEDRIADVFGNVYVEKCVKCKQYYRRRVIVPTLGRRCDNLDCGGTLRKTGTRMGGETPPEPLARAAEQAVKAELAIVFGSSMLVSPFCVLPGKAKKMVIINLQETPYDNEATLKINARCDEVMRAIMEALEMKDVVQSFTYTQPYSILWHLSEDKKTIVFEVKGDPTRPQEPPRCVERVEVRTTTQNGSSQTREMEQDANGNFALSALPLETLQSVAFTIEFQEALDPERQLTITKSFGTDELQTPKTIVYEVFKTVHYA